VKLKFPFTAYDSKSNVTNSGFKIIPISFLVFKKFMTSFKWKDDINLKSSLVRIKSENKLEEALINKIIKS